MRMILTSHQLGRTFTNPLRDPAAQKAAMVQEELQRRLLQLLVLLFGLSHRLRLKDFCNPVEPDKGTPSNQ